MKKKICKPCYAIAALFMILTCMAPGVFAASAETIQNVMTGDGTNMGMIIGISVAAGIAGLVIIGTIIFAIVSKKKKNANNPPKH